MDCSTHVWASDRGSVSVGCGPLNGPVSPGGAARILFFSDYQLTKWAGEFFEEFEC